jgi:hypothetical protein
MVHVRRSDVVGGEDELSTTTTTDEPQNYLASLQALRDLTVECLDLWDEAARRFEALPADARQRIDCRAQDDNPLDEALDAIVHALTYASTPARRAGRDRGQRFVQVIERIEDAIAAEITDGDDRDVELIRSLIRLLEALGSRSLEQVRFFLAQALMPGGGTTSYLITQAKWDPKRGRTVLEARHSYRLSDDCLAGLRLQE